MLSVILRNEGSHVVTRRVRILRKLRMTCTGIGPETCGTVYLAKGSFSILSWLTLVMAPRSGEILSLLFLLSLAMAPRSCEILSLLFLLSLAMAPRSGEILSLLFLLSLEMEPRSGGEA